MKTKFQKALIVFIALMALSLAAFGPVLSTAGKRRGGDGDAFQRLHRRATGSFGQYG